MKALPQHGRWPVAPYIAEVTRCLLSVGPRARVAPRASPPRPGAGAVCCSAAAARSRLARELVHEVSPDTVSLHRPPPAASAFDGKGGSLSAHVAAFRRLAASRRAWQPCGALGWRPFGAGGRAAVGGGEGWRQPCGAVAASLRSSVGGLAAASRRSRRTSRHTPLGARQGGESIGALTQVGCNGRPRTGVCWASLARG